MALIAHAIAGSGNGSSVTSLPVSTLGANLIILAAAELNSATAPTDSAGNFYTFLGTVISGTGAYLSIWYLLNPVTSANHTASIYGFATNPSIALYAFNQIVSFDASNQNALSFPATTLAAGAVVPAVANDLFIAISACSAGSVSSIDSGFTLTDSIGFDAAGFNIGLALAYFQQGAPGALNPTWTNGSPGMACAWLGTFKTTSTPVPLTLSCPADSGFAQVGNPYTATLVVAGGTAPFTFSFLGASPPWLALDALTGELTGTPPATGVFTYSVTVTDSLGHTATTSPGCTITVRTIPPPPPPPPPPGPRPPVPLPPFVAGQSALRWQVEAPGRPGRWFAHTYSTQIAGHYLVEPSEANPNDQELYLFGLGIFESGGNSDAGLPVLSSVQLPSLDGGDERAQKLYPDAMVMADGTGPLTVTPAFDNAQSYGAPVVLTPPGAIEQFQVNLASLANLQLHRNISAVLSWSGGPGGPRIYAWEPAAYLQPYLSKFLVTQFINLSYPGWKSHRRLYPGLISTAPVIFTIKCQDGRTFTYLIPSTGGQFLVLAMMADHGVKDLAFAYQLDGQGIPFALFPDAFTIETKGWRDPEFLDLAIFKT